MNKLTNQPTNLVQHLPCVCLRQRGEFRVADEFCEWQRGEIRDENPMLGVRTSQDLLSESALDFRWERVSCSEISQQVVHRHCRHVPQFQFPPLSFPLYHCRSLAEQSQVIDGRRRRRWWNERTMEERELGRSSHGRRRVKTVNLRYLSTSGKEGGRDQSADWVI